MQDRRVVMDHARPSLIAAFFVLSAVALVGQAVKVDFEQDEAGKPPKGFSFALTGQGKPGVWIVRKDDGGHGNVLVQTDADRTDYRFPVAIYNDVTAKDVDLSVRFKPISGKGDQGAGLVWGYRDQNNYYITRCNALEDNCTIYPVVKGRRQGSRNKAEREVRNLGQRFRSE